MVMRFYVWPLTLSHHGAKFDCFRHCGNGVKTFLISHLISTLESHVILRVGASHGKSSLSQVWWR